MCLALSLACWLEWSLATGTQSKLNNKAADIAEGEDVEH